MNYDKIILEMIGRIKELEDKVEILEDFKRYYGRDKEIQKDPFEDNKKLINDIPEIESGESGRVQSRMEIMKILKEKYQYQVRKGNRSEGSGVVATKNGKSYNIKISFSRSYFDFVNEDVLCCGWHSLAKKDICDNSFDFYIFVVSGENDFLYYFIFSRDDLFTEFFNEKDSDNKKIHFYFRVDKNCRPYEAREGERDMTYHYNNWGIFDC